MPRGHVSQGTTQRHKPATALLKACNSRRLTGEVKEGSEFLHTTVFLSWISTVAARATLAFGTKLSTGIEQAAVERLSSGEKEA